MFLDSLTEEAGVGQLSAPLNGPVLCSLSSTNDPTGFLGGDVVHGLLVTTSTKRSEWKIAWINRTVLIKLYVAEVSG